MFNVEFGKVYRVKYARSGAKQTGETYGLIALVENENQPEGIERPSKSNSTVKVWMPTLPSGITDGCMVKINSFTGFNWKHIVHEQYGKPVYTDVIELLNAVIELAKVEG